MLIPAVIMAAVWMVLILPVGVFQDSLGILVLSILMNVKQLVDVEMGNVKI
jgi:hypothetical protein